MGARDIIQRALELEGYAPRGTKKGKGEDAKQGAFGKQSQV
jgi:hypothetical protein